MSTYAETGQRFLKEQLRIMQIYCKGLTYREIAEREDISITTVNDKIRKLRHRFGCKNTAELAVKLTKLGKIQ